MAKTNPSSRADKLIGGCRIYKQPETLRQGDLRLLFLNICVLADQFGTCGSARNFFVNLLKSTSIAVLIISWSTMAKTNPSSRADKLIEGCRIYKQPETLRQGNLRLLFLNICVLTDQFGACGSARNFFVNLLKSTSNAVLIISWSTMTKTNPSSRADKLIGGCLC